MRSVTLKSAMTPSFMGLIATMLPGVRPSISFASLPTASTSPVFLLMATIEGSFTTMPLPRAYTSVLAVPRSMARSLEKMLNSDRRLWLRVGPEWNPLFDMTRYPVFLQSFLPALSPGVLLFCFQGWLRVFYAPTPTLRTPKVLVLGRPKSRGYSGQLLNYNLFLLRVHSALCGLSRDCNYRLSRLQRRREVVKLSVGIHHRNFTTIDHDARPHLRLAGYLNHMPMLNERIQFQIDGFGFLPLRDDREAILLALCRFFAARVVGLHHPVIRTFT